MDLSVSLARRTGIRILLATALSDPGEDRQVARRLGAGLLHRLGADDPVWRDGRHGRPALPGGLHGSLAHTSGFCTAACASAGSVRALGVDVEAVSRARELELATWRHLLHPQEIVQIHKIVLDRRLRFALRRHVAKEAAGKAWATWTGLPPPPTAGRVAASGPWRFLCHCSGLPDVHGVWLRTGEWLLSVAWVPV